jgi:small-conductance mechanosensitive channel
MKQIFAALLISLLLLGLASIGVSIAQDDAPTPTPIITTTESPETSDSAESAESAATPTPTPIVTTTESTDSHTTITVFGLTLAQWLQLAISAAVVLLVAQYGGALLVRLARRLTRRTETELDDEILSVIRPQVSWFIAAVGFQIATARLAFTSESVDALLGDVYFVLYWFVIVATVWRTVDFLIQWHAERQSPDADQALSQQASILLQRLARIAVAIVGVIVLLGHFGIDVLAVTAALGLTGFAIALAAQDTISNIISGLVIMIDRPFSVGDRIDVPALDTWADVVEIGMRSTKALTRDNRLVMIPNASIVDTNVVNYSLPDPTYRLQTDIGIGSGENIPDVVRSLTQAVRAVDGVLADKPVDVLFTGFGDSSNTFRVRADKRRVTHRVCTTIQEVAAKEGIDMPNPTYAVDNQVKINADDVDGIATALREPKH